MSASHERLKHFINVTRPSGSAHIVKMTCWPTNKLTNNVVEPLPPPQTTNVCTLSDLPSHSPNIHNAFEPSIQPTNTPSPTTVRKPPVIQIVESEDDHVHPPQHTYKTF